MRSVVHILLLVLFGVLLPQQVIGAPVEELDIVNPGYNYVLLKSSRNMKSQLTTPNTIYAIQDDINLRKKTIDMPANSILLFDGGKIRNGVLKGNKTMIAGNPIISAIIDGTFQNKLFYSSWFDNETSITVAAAKTVCLNGATLIIDDDRKLNETLYLFGKGNLKGKGGSISFVSKPSNAACVVCGTDGISPIPWNGVIDNVVFNLADYKYGIAMCNVAHCAVTNNTLNALALPSYRSGKLLGRFNSANYTHVTCTQEDILIEGNVLNMHGNNEGTASKIAAYESITVADFTDNVRILNNEINNSTDDLGIHSCSNVLVEGNVITTEGGRIYCADSRDVIIAKNSLGCYSNSMGIMITMESQNRIGENIQIYDNYVHPIGSKKLDYGIRVNNGKHINIFNNKIEGQLHIGYCNEYVLENLSYHPIEVTEEDKIVDYVTVANNTFTQIYGNAWGKKSNTPHSVLFENNTITGPNCFISNLPTVISRWNVVNAGEK